MPFTQNAPREPGWAGFGAILVTLPSSMVRNEPHNAAHSQQVLGTISAAGKFEGGTFIAISSCGPKAIRVQFERKQDSARWHCPVTADPSPACRGALPYAATW